MDDISPEVRQQVESFLSKLSPQPNTSSAVRSLQSTSQSTSPTNAPEEKLKEILPGGELLADMMNSERFAKLAPEIRAAVLSDVAEDIQGLAKGLIFALYALQVLSGALSRHKQEDFTNLQMALFALAEKLAEAAYKRGQNCHFLNIDLPNIDEVLEDITPKMVPELFKAVVDEINRLTNMGLENAPVSNDVNIITPKEAGGE